MSNTLLIVENSDIIRRGLVHIIGSFGLFDQIHEFSGDSNIESSIKKLEPDVLIINPSLVSGGLMEWIGKQNGRIKIAAIINGRTGTEAPERFSEIFTADDTGPEIRKKADTLADRPSAPPRQEETENVLSPREKDVLRLLAKGMSNKEISEQLFISPHTVITHRKNITRKLNIKSVAGLLVYAIINEIVTVDEMQQD